MEQRFKLKIGAHSIIEEWEMKEWGSYEDFTGFKLDHVVGILQTFKPNSVAYITLKQAEILLRSAEYNTSWNADEIKGGKRTLNAIDRYVTQLKQIVNTKNIQGMDNTFADSVIKQAIGLSKTEKKYKAILATGMIEERELISLRSAMQGKKEGNIIDIVQEAFAKHKEIVIDRSHQQKGIDYLRNLWQTPNGKVRKNSPFDAVKVYILKSYSHFRLVDIKNTNPNFANWKAVFRCYSTDGLSFDYYWNGSGITFVNNQD